MGPAVGRDSASRLVLTSLPGESLSAPKPQACGGQIPKGGGECGRGCKKDESSTGGRCVGTDGVWVHDMTAGCGDGRSGWRKSWERCLGKPWGPGTWGRVLQTEEFGLDPCKPFSVEHP